MANGDFVVKVLIKSRLAGGGHSLTGNASNEKVEIVASITGTYLTGGIVLNAVDLGLTKIDAIFVGGNVFISGDTTPTAAVPNLGVYAATSGNDGILILVTDKTTQSEAAQTGFSITVLAYGDSNAGPVLV